MPASFNALLSLHLACAFAATLAFWVAAGSAKGGPRHRAAGRWFARLIYAAAATGGVLALSNLLWPTAVRPPDPDASADAVRAAVRETRQTMWLVLYALVIIVAPVQHGLAVVRAGARPARTRSALHALFGLLGIAGSAVLLPMSIIWQRWPFLVVVPIGFVVGLRNLAYAGRSAAVPADWQREHLTSMITAGVALHTVFFVFATPRLLGRALDGSAAVLPWILPLAVGLPVMLWLRRTFQTRPPG